MQHTLYVVRTPLAQQVAAGFAASRRTVLTPVGRMSYAKLQPSELANDNFDSERVRRAFTRLLRCVGGARAADRGLQDKAGAPAAGPLVLIDCLHIVLDRSRACSSR